MGINWQNPRSTSGVTCIVDRYAFSGVAYSVANGLDFDWCKAPDIGLLKPDIVFYLKMDPLLASKRGDYGQEKYEKVEFQQLVAQAFEKMNDGWIVNIL
ncbi:MAG: hypothetical protein RL059_750 [Bacteroidota bacterium]